MGGSIEATVGAALRAVATTFENEAKATSGVAAKRCRSRRLGDRVLGHPDPGAEAVAVWLRANLR
ncbi:MAG: DAK2 domain-containing protein [Planctomycetota bacterium]